MERRNFQNPLAVLIIGMILSGVASGLIAFGFYRATNINILKDLSCAQLEAKEIKEVCNKRNERNIKDIAEIKTQVGMIYGVVVEGRNYGKHNFKIKTNLPE